MNDWLRHVFAPENVDQTVAGLVASQGDSGGVPSERARLKNKLADAETRLSKFQAAIEAGVNPAAMVEAINTAQSERAALKAELDHAPTPSTYTDAEVYAMIDSLGDLGKDISKAKPERLASIYESVDLHVQFEHATRAAYATIHPVGRVDSARVRGGT
ncbi:MAG: hypothetical protein IJH84_14710 [Saccharopolyspora sp.]|uniref:hypothetical protein n=1 Tax=Saccharopolyspora sp. TaxID=33915 RepID=UPI0025D22EFB|nr:hypothetical protein [Saccharopolyspora sp.]MBQ6642265.1 hypothetical protein [Saccharopolyspora sp.]